MGWFFRLVGIAGIFGFFGWSINHWVEASDDIRASEAQEASDEEGSTDSDDPDADPSAPRYVAYVPGVAPGSYVVLDAPGSNDWDHGLRRGEDHDIPEPDGELMPGLYASSFTSTDCTYELYRVGDNQRERMIGSDSLRAGRLLVTLNEIEPDRFASDGGCGEWIEWSPLVEPLREAPNGDYWVGDLANGIWDVPAGCHWEEVVGFRGSQVHDIMEAGIGPGTIQITNQSMGFRVRRCHQPLIHATMIDE